MMYSKNLYAEVTIQSDSLSHLGIMVYNIKPFSTIKFFLKSLIESLLKSHFLERKYHVLVSPYAPWIKRIVLQQKCNSSYSSFLYCAEYVHVLQVPCFMTQL